MWTLASFNTLDAETAASSLMACCASKAWAEKVAAGRPYGSTADLRTAALAAFDGLGEAELDVAHAAHPPIGQPPAEAGGEQTDAAWSRGEQSRAMGADAAVRASLAEAGRGYEDRFGRVFLICATGLTGEEILAEAERRLHNDDETEAAEARIQLRKIVMLRLAKAVGP